MATRCREAFSLLEVILAIAILTGAMAILGELARSSLEAARTARDTNQAELLCESKLSELLAGLIPLESVQDATFEDTMTAISGTPITSLDTSGQIWLYSIEVVPIDEYGLTEVRVTVTQDMLPEQKPVSVSLVRWMIDPNAIATTETPTEEPASDTTGTSTTSTGEQP